MSGFNISLRIHIEPTEQITTKIRLHLSIDFWHGDCVARALLWVHQEMVVSR